MNVDGQMLMLNERESKHWVDTGMLSRIPEGDNEDQEYLQVRERMMANGDHRYYEQCCPK